jgi:type VI secretion system protein ImpL
MSDYGSQLKYALGITGLVSFYGIVSLIVWFLGSSLGLGNTERIVIIALLLITWPAAVLINHFRKKRAARVAEPMPKASRVGTQPKHGQAAPSRIHVEMTRSAEEAVQWLRSTRLGGEKAGDAIYALPWYLIAGPMSSGKTSLALSSGLDFHALPSQRRAELNLVRPTADCEWRVADAAVLLDTAGRYQADGPARDEWAALIETVKKYRGARPLDGLLLVVDAAQVLRWGEPEIEQQAKTLRARLDEMIQQVRTRFPVYLIFTHLDAVEGFREFFSSRIARAEVWGATIPLEKAANAHALFDVEFDHLQDSLLRRRLLRLAASAPAEWQLRVFEFPLRFGEARSKLGLFTAILFRPNPFSESPLLRGFYFTANLTEGTEQGDAVAVRAVGQGFFAEKYFKEVLLRDQNVAGAYQALQKRPSRLRSLLLAAAALVLLILVAGIFISFFGNRALIAEATERGARVDEIIRADVGKDPLKKDAAGVRVELEAIDALREALNQIDKYERESPPLSLRLGLYSGGAISPYLRTIYFDSVEQRFKRPTVAALERDLRSFVAGATPAQSARPSSTNTQTPTESAEDILGRHYDLLKAYLMLSDASKVEPTFLAGQLENYWRRFSPPDMEIVALQQLDFFSRQAGSEDAPHIKADDKLVSEVRRKLVAYPAVNRFYKRVTTEINGKTAAVSLDSILEGRGRGVLVGTYTVPGSYTIVGYREHMTAAFQTAADEISKDDWVMGAQAAQDQAGSTDLSKLRGVYFRDYADHWRKFLKSVNVQPFKTKDDAVEALKALSATDSPMEQVMLAVARHTNLSAEPERVGFWGWIRSFFSSRSETVNGGDTDVEKEFLPLFQFVAAGGDGKGNSLMSQYRTEMRRLLEPLEAASDDQLAQTSKALLTGKDDIGLQKVEQNVSSMLETFKTTATGDAAALLKQPLGNVRALLYGGGYEQIEKAWREQVYPQARSLEAGYPFTDTGESSQADLARFLNPSNGTFTTFFNDRLASSFDDAQGQWKLKEAGAFKFSDDFVTYLNSARRLREALFATGSAQPEVSYEIKLEPVADADVLVEVDGQRVETRGTSSAKFTWPARAGSGTGATIKVIPSASAGTEIPPLNFPGEWGLFRLFEAGGGTRGATPDGGYALSWKVGDVQVRATLRPASATNPFQRTLFTGMHAPQNLRK